jgi:hypothetical protein
VEVAQSCITQLVSHGSGATREGGRLEVNRTRLGTLAPSPDASARNATERGARRSKQQHARADGAGDAARRLTSGYGRREHREGSVITVGIVFILERQTSYDGALVAYSRAWLLERPTAEELHATGRADAGSGLERHRGATRRGERAANAGCAGERRLRGRGRRRREAQAA